MNINSIKIAPSLASLFNSKAFIELTNASRVALFLLLSQKGTTSQKEIKYPYDCAEKYMKGQTFANSIKQLKKIGFINISQIGGLRRKTNIYTFINKWEDLGYIDDNTVSWANKYHKYLLSPTWKGKAQKKLKQANYRCQLCNSDNLLQVHHRTYDRIYKERLSDLIVLCETCHKKHHTTENGS